MLSYLFGNRFHFIVAKMSQAKDSWIAHSLLQLLIEQYKIYFCGDFLYVDVLKTKDEMLKDVKKIFMLVIHCVCHVKRKEEKEDLSNVQFETTLVNAFKKSGSQDYCDNIVMVANSLAWVCI